MKYKYSFMTYTDHIYNGLPCNPNLRYQKIFHKNKKFQRVLKEILTWTWILQEMMVFFFLQSLHFHNKFYMYFYAQFNFKVSFYYFFKCICEIRRLFFSSETES